MITYEYLCTNCEHQLEKEQQIKAKPLKKCPECKKNTLQRIISGGYGSFIHCKEATTIGQLADRNYKKNRVELEQQEAEKKANTPKEDSPWWGKGDKRKISNMNKQQKKKYIMEGE